MKKENAMKWIKALRSGKYEQTRSGHLRDSDGYCCLGVLCHINNITITGDETLPDYFDLQMLDLSSNDGQLPKYYKTKHGKLNTLAELNDVGLSFKQIANIIENNYEYL